MAKIRAIVKRPDEKYGHVCNISHTLSNLQNTVGGYIEAIPLTDGMVVICNEEGKLRGMEHNMRLPWGDVLVGTIIICGADGDEFSNIPIEFKTWKKLVDEWEART